MKINIEEIYQYYDNVIDTLIIELKEYEYVDAYDSNNRPKIINYQVEQTYNNIFEKELKFDYLPIQAIRHFMCLKKNNKPWYRKDLKSYLLFLILGSPHD